MPVLLNQKIDWADEFDIEGFEIMDEDQWVEYQEALTEAEYPIEQYFGTNEFVEFESFEDLMRSISVKFISENEKEILTRLLDVKYGSYGVTAIPE